ncbi:MAG: hypothetical protein E7554_01670, partial [Ruminococcaceae bacterium]|nr:hypothetical protein [Oscillospiraceae bacterium]
MLVIFTLIPTVTAFGASTPDDVVSTSDISFTEDASALPSEGNDKEVVSAGDVPAFDFVFPEKMLLSLDESSVTPLAEGVQIMNSASVVLTGETSGTATLSDGTNSVGAGSSAELTVGSTLTLTVAPGTKSSKIPRKVTVEKLDAETGEYVFWFETETASSISTTASHDHANIIYTLAEPMPDTDIRVTVAMETGCRMFLYHHDAIKTDSRPSTYGSSSEGGTTDAYGIGGIKRSRSASNYVSIGTENYAFPSGSTGYIKAKADNEGAVTKIIAKTRAKNSGDDWTTLSDSATAALLSGYTPGKYHLGTNTFTFTFDDSLDYYFDVHYGEAPYIYAAHMNEEGTAPTTALCDANTSLIQNDENGNQVATGVINYNTISRAWTAYIPGHSYAIVPKLSYDGAVKTTYVEVSPI